MLSELKLNGSEAFRREGIYRGARIKFQQYLDSRATAVIMGEAVFSDVIQKGDGQRIDSDVANRWVRLPWFGGVGDRPLSDTASIILFGFG